MILVFKTNVIFMNMVLFMSRSQFFDQIWLLKKHDFLRIWGEKILKSSPYLAWKIEFLYQIRTRKKKTKLDVNNKLQASICSAIWNLIGGDMQPTKNCKCCVEKRVDKMMICGSIFRSKKCSFSAKQKVFSSIFFRTLEDNLRTQSRTLGACVHLSLIMS